MQYIVMYYYLKRVARYRGVVNVVNFNYVIHQYDFFEPINYTH